MEARLAAAVETTLALQATVDAYAAHGACASVVVRACDQHTVWSTRRRNAVHDASDSCVRTRTYTRRSCVSRIVCFSSPCTSQLTRARAA